MINEGIQNQIVQAVERVKRTNPMVGSITHGNHNFVATSASPEVLLNIYLSKKGV